jgi:hypothetical protein
MPNYQNAKIYKIRCSVTGEDYIDSTTLSLNQRIAYHKMEYKRSMDGINKKYSLSHKVMDADDYEVILLENYPCKSKQELTARIHSKNKILGRAIS